MTEYKRLTRGDIVAKNDEACIWDKGHNVLSWVKVKPYIVGRVYREHGHTWVMMRRAVDNPA